LESSGWLSTGHAPPSRLQQTPYGWLGLEYATLNE